MDDSTGVPLSDFKKDSSPGADTADEGAMAIVAREEGAWLYTTVVLMRGEKIP